MHCLWCGSSRLRTSPLRVSDLPRLFLLQQPVRCHFCNERDYASVFSLRKLKTNRRSPNAESQRRESNAA